MLPLFKVFTAPNIMKPIEETMRSGFLGEGPRVKDFEEDLKKYIGCENVLTVNSGTSAIRLALRLAGVSYGDEVISNPMTCFATNSPILEAGAIPVWADCESDTGNINLESVEKRITSKTKAIITVHYGGVPYYLEFLNKIGKKYGIPVIEDACQALGSLYDQKQVGNFSDFTCFSFQAIKYINTGDGGCLVCRNKEDYEKGKLLRWYGLPRNNSKGKDARCDDDVIESGYKYHLNDVAATIGIENLKWIDNLITTTKNNVEFFNQELKNVKGISLRRIDPRSNPNYWFYTIFIDGGKDKRDNFLDKLNQKGVMCSKVHRLNTELTVFKNLPKDVSGATEFYYKQCAIPTGWWINQIDRDFIMEAINSTMKEI